MTARPLARRAADALRTAYRRVAMLEPERCPFCNLSTVERSRDHVRRTHPELDRPDPTARKRFEGAPG